MSNYLRLNETLSPSLVVRLIAFLALILVMLWAVSVGQASSTIVVNTFEDVKQSSDGLCSLREAIIAANSDKASGGEPGECVAGDGADTILLPAGSHVLSRSDSGKEDASQTGDLDIAADLIISGAPGAIIDASGINGRVFHVLDGHVKISDVNIKGGTVSEDGGGIYNSGVLDLEKIALTGNAASGHGGGIYNEGTLTLINSTVSGNSALGGGGGVYNAGSLTLVNATISDNVASLGGGVDNASGVVNLHNSIIAANFAPSAPDCSGTLSSGGYNLLQDTSGCTIDGDLTGNILGQDPSLGPLADNGGGTLTHALLLGSPGIDAGQDANCPLDDQRGEPRPADGDGDGRYHCDIGAFEAGRHPVTLIRAFPDAADEITIQGLVSSAPDTLFTLEFFSGDSCDPADLSGPFHTAQVTTDAKGYFYFTTSAPEVPVGYFVTATTTDPNGNWSGYAQCITVGPDNDSWPRALSLDSLFSSTATYDQHLDRSGQSRWFKFTIEPNSKMTITLTNLPDNYDLTVYKDIRATFDALTAPQDQTDLVRLSTEFAPDVFSPDVFSPDVFSPDVFSPDVFSPDVFSPDVFSPDVFSPDVFSPDVFSPDVFSPDVFSPDAFSPDVFSPDVFSPDVFSPDVFSPDVFSPDAFSGAQSRSLIAASAFDGTASEGVILNTWNNTGEFYLRVRGRNGRFSWTAPFRVTVQRAPGLCEGVAPLLATSPMALPGNHRTLILTDLSRMDRMEGTAAEKADLLDGLDALALRPEVDGLVVDISVDLRVQDANVQADANPACPYAKNLVAQSIKDIVDGYRAQTNSNLEYLVIIGGDEIIPFPRHPDNALLANEQNYVPPVRDNTASQASLRLGYVLGQDFYGSRFVVSLNNSTFPIPDLPVGRLVETALEINTMLNAYLSTDGGVLQPTSSLVTGYDFLADVAAEIQTELQDGTGELSATLIADRDLSPENPLVWTADDLRAALLGERHDLIFLAGHFSANSALAADYTTRMLAEEVTDATGVDLTNVILYSAGCHSGYNIVNQHGVPIVTRQPDWAQAFALQGVTFIGGTGYQYGDTDFIEYSELLYLEFSQQLRADTGTPVSIGQALVAAKQAYLAQIPQVNGLHEKALLEATIFGLPMLSVDLPGRFTPPADLPDVPTPIPFGTDPGQTLGLTYADITVSSPLNEQTRVLTDYTGDREVTASYLEGTNGDIFTSPGEPALPLEIRNVTVPNTVLRGIGIRGSIHTEEDVLPLVGAPTTEMRGVHTPFLADEFYPVQPYSVNYYDALLGGGTRLMVKMAQHKTSPTVSDPQQSTRRQFSSMDLRLFYSDNVGTFGDGSVPALSAAPAIVRVSGLPRDDEVTFRVNVVGNPAAGIQEVWVTYTDMSAPFPRTWQSLDLTQRATDSTLWDGTLPLNGVDPQHIRYMVQAVNGVGLVSLATNLGAFYIPGFDFEPTEATALTFQVPPTSGPYGTQATFNALLTDGAGAPLPGQRILFRLGPQTRQALTDEDGAATVTLALLGLPGPNAVRALFTGTDVYQASLTTSSFRIDRQATVLELDPPSAQVFSGEDTVIVAVLTDVTGRRLGEKTVFFIVSGDEGSYSKAEITNYSGLAYLGAVPLPPGTYNIDAYFSGVIPLGADTITLTDIRYEPSTATGDLLLLDAAPVAVDDSYSTDEDTVLDVAAPGVLANDDAVDGDALTAILVDGPNEGTLTLNGDGSFTYTPDTDFNGTDSFNYVASDSTNDSNIATVTITVNPVNDPPICSLAVPSDKAFWPPDKKFHPVSVLGVTDPEEDPFTIEILHIYQDEPTGTGKYGRDGRVVGPNAAEVRAERDGTGDGRVYHIEFRATDDGGEICSDSVQVGVVPHDQSDQLDDFDSGPPYYDSITGEEFYPD